MTTKVNLWYLTESLSEGEMFQTNVVEKIKTNILCLIIFFWKSCHLRVNVAKYGGARKAIHDTTIEHRKCVICMPDK